MKTTTNYKKEVTELLNILCVDYDLTDKQAEFLDKIKSKKENTADDVAALKALEDELLNGTTDEKTDIAIIKKFKYVNPDKKSYKLLTLQNSAIENLKNGDIIAFRFDQKYIDIYIKNGVTYSENNSNYDMSNMTFENNLDYCMIEKIDRKSGKITTVSKLTNEKFYIYADNLQNEIKNKRCVSDDGVPFVVFSKIA